MLQSCLLRKTIPPPFLRINVNFFFLLEAAVKMRFSTSAILVTLLGWIGFAAAHNIQLRAHSRECFHETLHRDDKMTVTFQVGDREFGGSGNLEIDFWVCCSGSCR